MYIKCDQKNQTDKGQRAVREGRGWDGAHTGDHVKHTRRHEWRHCSLGSSNEWTGQHIKKSNRRHRCRRLRAEQKLAEGPFPCTKVTDTRPGSHAQIQTKTMAGVWPTRAQVSWKHGTGPKQGNRRVKEEKGNICDNWRNCGQWLVLYDVDSDRLVCLSVGFLLAH